MRGRSAGVIGRRTAGALGAAAALGLALGARAETGRPLGADDLVALARVSDPQVSPDGRLAAFDLSSADLGRDRRAHSLWVVPTDASAPPRKVAAGTSPRFSPDGAFLYYLAKSAGRQEVFRTRLAGDASSEGTAVTSTDVDVDSFRISPDGRTLVLALSVFPGSSPAETRAREDARQREGSGRLYDHLFIRHWDAWADGTQNHLFAQNLGPDGAPSGPLTPLTPSFDGDVPSKPFGGDEDYVLTPDGRTVLFSARVAGKMEPLSTNFDIFSAPIDGSAAPHDETSNNPAWDAGVVVSPDQKTIAWRAMKRPGFEADRFGVMVRSLSGGPAREIDAAFDRSAETLAFSGDGRSLYVRATDQQHARLFRMSLETGRAEPLTQEGSVEGFDVARPPGGDVLVYAADALDRPADLYVLRPGRAPLRLTDVNRDALKSVAFSPYEAITFKGWNDEDVHGWVVRPAGFDPRRRYPVVMMIHGGPQGSWEDAFSYRWNPEVWAGWGYAVVMIDFHGSTGYGQAFTDAISNHWGDRPLEDLKKGWSYVLKRYPYLDASRACAAGASYGGYMTYWIAGVWNAPFKCLIDHDGVFDTRLMGYETEELWFSEWENGGAPPFQSPETYARFDPMDHVKDWTKPILVIHSGQDFRIPLDQGIAAFTAAQLKGLPSEFLTFPDENHWVLKPLNSLKWHATVKEWLDRWTAEAPPVRPAS